MHLCLSSSYCRYILHNDVLTVIMFAISENADNKNANKLRYTSVQRNHECKKQKYKKIILDLKKEKIADKTMTELESILSIHNKKH